MVGRRGRGCKGGSAKAWQPRCSTGSAPRSTARASTASSAASVRPLPGRERASERGERERQRQQVTGPSSEKEREVDLARERAALSCTVRTVQLDSAHGQPRCSTGSDPRSTARASTVSSAASVRLSSQTIIIYKIFLEKYPFYLHSIYFKNSCVPVFFFSASLTLRAAGRLS